MKATLIIIQNQADHEAAKALGGEWHPTAVARLLNRLPKAA
jgi:hypothetical protein